MEQPNGVELPPDALTQALELSGLGVVVLDAERRVRYLNRAAERLTGLQRRRILGQPLQDIAPPHLARHFRPRGPRHRTRLDTLVRHHGDIRLERADGSRIWVSVSHHPLQGSPLSVVYLSDVQVQRSAEARSTLLTIGFDHVSAAVLIARADGTIEHANRGLRQFLGYSDNALVGRPLLDLFDAPANNQSRPAQLFARLQAGHSVRSELRVHHHNGTGLWCELQANPVFDDNGRLSHLVVMLTDISEARVHAMLLNRLLEAMARETPTAEVMALLCAEVERIAPDVIASVVRLDSQGRLRPLAGPSLPASYIQAMDGAPSGPGCGACGTAMWSGKTVVSSNIATDPNWEGIREQPLQHGLAACWSTPVEASDGRILGSFAFYYRTPREPDPFHRRLVDTCVHLCAVAMERDLTRQRIHQLAFHDLLTGLPNRSLLLARAAQSLAAAEHQQQPLAVLSLDIERFRQVNQALGQAAGDLLLREIGRRVQSVLGVADIAGRLSGDEFALVICPCTAEHARHLSGQLMEVIGQPLSLEQTTLHPRASIGISLYPDNARDVETLLQQADLARAQARQHGLLPVRFYSEAMDSAMQERRRLEASLRQAMAENRLQVHYQPQVNLQTGQLHSVEALTRWIDPVMGDIPPSQFIPLAEECGVIGELGMWVIAQACTDLRQWQAQGLAVDSVSVNLSPTDFRDPGLPERVSAQLREQGVSAGQLVLEITEAVLLDRHPDTLRTLRALSNSGIRLSLDDFGTGYSSFNYLRDLPVAEIKLDQSFVADLEHDPVSRALAEAVVRIGQAMKLAIVAEGVTRADQVGQLRELGFTAAQGFHYATALSAPAMSQWLQQRRRHPA